jgi:hypothetical protein
MRLHLIVGMAIAGTLSAGPAFADWQYTRWGMTPQQVLNASGGKVHPGSTPDTMEGYYYAGGRSYAATFRFRSGALARVDLALSTEPLCQSMALDLANIYGAPDRKNLGQYGMAVAEWLDGSAGNDVVLTYLVKTCTVTYGPLASAASTGL